MTPEHTTDRKRPIAHVLMDARVVLQEREARRVASVLGGAHFPAKGRKRTHLGWFVPRAVGGVPQRTIRWDVRVRDFPSTQHPTVLIEKRTVDRLLKDGRCLYVEVYTDDTAWVVDLTQVRHLLVWERLGMNRTTVVSDDKVEKVACLVPRQLGEVVHLRHVRQDETVPAIATTEPLF